eukprot:6184259-Pleurochrysis_carterae.AAC.2
MELRRGRRGENGARDAVGRLLGNGEERIRKRISKRSQGRASSGFEANCQGSEMTAINGEATARLGEIK